MRLGRVVISLLLCAALLLMGQRYKSHISIWDLIDQDPATEAESLLQTMTLEQKIAQMLMVNFRYDEQRHRILEINAQIRDAISRYDFGGVILFAPNCESTEQTTKLVYDMQQAAESSALGLRMLVSIDQEGGAITRLSAGTNMLGNMALAATGSTQFAESAAAIIGEELAACGFTMDMAPDADVNSNPNNPIIGIRSFSDDPRLVADYTKAYVEGLRSQNIIPVLKHFPGHGDTGSDTHTSLALVDKTYEELRRTDLLPFSEVASAADVIMTAHIQFPQIEKETYRSIYDGKEVTLPATLSRTIIHDILREDLGFDGIVITDALDMDAIAKHFDRKDTARMAINAGVDILLIPFELNSAYDIRNIGTYIDDIAAMVRAGDIPEAEIDDSVLRILEIKEAYGILAEKTTTREEQVAAAVKTVGSQEHHDAEWEMAKKSITLLKDENAIPTEISGKDRIAVFVPLDGSYQSVRFAVDQLKKEGTIPQQTPVDIAVYQNMTWAAMKSMLTKASIILFGMETGNAASLRTQNSSGWMANLGRRVLTEAHAQGKKVIFLSLQLPYDAALFPDADAILCAYNNVKMYSYPGGDGCATYGAGIPAAVYCALGGCPAEGSLPVQIYALDDKGNFSDKILFERTSR